MSADRSLDDAVVELHERGETVFQAMARAASLPGVSHLDPALLVTVPAGRLPLANGGSAPLPRLDARGVASILDFERESADYEAARVLVAEPTLPREPRIPAQELWPALRAAGYKVGAAPERLRTHPRTRAELAAQTDLDERLIHRICAGEAETVAVTVAVTILDALGRGDLATRIQDVHVTPWETARAFAYCDRLEYLVELALLLPGIAADPGLTDGERQAIADIRWLSVTAQAFDAGERRIATAEERLVAAHDRFLAVHDRQPTPLSPRLRTAARESFKIRRKRARARARALRGGRGGPPVTASAVYGRTHRLRTSGALPYGSKPLAYRPLSD